MSSIIDRDIGAYNLESVKKFMQLALKCCQEETKARPTMLEVVRELENLCSVIPQSEANNPSDSNGSSSTASGFASTSLYYERNMYISSDYAGSNLVSGVFPDIKPR